MQKSKHKNKLIAEKSKHKMILEMKNLRKTSKQTHTKNNQREKIK